MSALQLSFTLRTSPNCKTVHLIGNWDGYKGQLPLSKDSSKTGGWKGTFRFQGASLQPGSRYWYYYIMDGHHVSHDPAQPSTTEPTTGRKLNILDVPATAAAAKSSRQSADRHSRRQSKDIPHGRALSPSRIQCPRPQKNYATRHLTTADYAAPVTVDALARKFAQSSFDDDSSEEDDSDIDSDADSDVPSLSSSSSGSRSPASSVSSSSFGSRSSSRGSADSCCTCERYGITRKGDRVRLDCGGARCGSDCASSDCNSSDDDLPSPSTRRHGVVIRSPASGRRH